MAGIERLCFHGHTHRPGVITDRLEFRSPEDLRGVYVPDGRKALCNVGSVGQPHDGDRRACYALFDGHAVRFRRVAYDVEATVRKIRVEPALDDFCGERLLDGR